MAQITKVKGGAYNDKTTENYQQNALQIILMYFGIVWDL